mgnify:CR=1 FL=1
MKEIFPGVFKKGKKLFTLNSTPGISFYGERLLKINNKEYREWNPRRSKLAAALLNGLRYFPFRKNSTVLYLGSAEGTTVSHLSDICTEGYIFGVDISAKCMRKFLMLCNLRKNIIPILADANRPITYINKVPKVDALFQDISQKNQTEIFIKNVDLFLKESCLGLIAIKARSIDVTRKPKKVIKEEISKLSEKFKILQKMSLFPYEKDHGFVVVKKEI